MRRAFGSVLRRRVYGRTRFQWVAEALHERALLTMHGQPSTFAESGELLVIERAIRAKKAPIVVDVGANRGDYAVEVLARGPNGLSLVCIEPSRSAFAVLAERVGSDSRATLVNAAVSGEAGTAELFSEDTGSPLASLYGEGPSETVRTIRLDRLLADLDLGHIDLLKVDVEGHELAVLRGTGDAIDDVEAIQFEIGQHTMDARVYLRDFYDLLGGTFAFYRILRDGLRPLGQYRVLHESFIGGNYLALREH